MGNIDSEVSKLDDFFTTDLNVVYRWKTASLFKEVVFTGLVNNIFDEQYVSNGYFFTYDVTTNGNTETIGGAGYYPQAGINFLVGVELKF
jgi:iron complex outermembrane receptor protein